LQNYYDIIVVGAGHAGIEAAVSSAKMGLSVGLITMDTHAVGRMSCNPAIGGTAKGHLVREIDALGGVMGQLADKTGIQFKMLNKSKGPAVWSPRCQSDKELYSAEARSLILDTPGIDLVKNMVTEIITDELKKDFDFIVKGVKTASGETVNCRAVIITSGTFLNAVMHTGMNQTIGGRIGEQSASGLSECLAALGFNTGRLKTGTPPRLDIDTIDFSKTEIQPGDENPQPFSFRTNRNNFPFQKQVDCYLTHTNEETHAMLRTGFADSPLFTGRIKGVGPRYCPSIEDKISRFADKPRHQIFLEPETLNGKTIYMNGFSTSLPLEVQEKAARTIPGLENVKLIKQGYAVEYDFFPTHQIYLTLETKIVSGLYFAGQVNGTSGYEEAAGQGLVAGINAALKIKNETPLILKRSEAYIGVLIDDLINKCPEEPYRMFTSCAEYRLVLRQDNADLRLSEKGYSAGLLDEHFLKSVRKKEGLLKSGIHYFNSNTVSPLIINSLLERAGSPAISQNEFLSTILKRSDIYLSDILNCLDKKENFLLREISGISEVVMQIETEIKYNGYIRRQNEQIASFEKNENIVIPDSFKYEKIKSLSSEAIDKLNKIRPKSIGQAMRIAGVRSSDISAILIYMRG
jgi:tRNA uridine 5-carboxymethylaminomethyl modification enzyme